jgi:hypothetical protein
MKEKKGIIHFARLSKSDRLKRVHKLLKSGRVYSTMQIIHKARVCAVNSIMCELRENKINIPPARRIIGGQ